MTLMTPKKIREEQKIFAKETIETPWAGLPIGGKNNLMSEMKMHMPFIYQVSLKCFNHYSRCDSLDFAFSLFTGLAFSLFPDLVFIVVFALIWFGFLDQFKWTCHLGISLAVTQDLSTLFLPQIPKIIKWIFFLKGKYSFFSLKLIPELCAPKQPQFFLLRKIWDNS